MRYNSQCKEAEQLEKRNYAEMQIYIAPAVDI